MSDLSVGASRSKYLGSGHDSVLSGQEGVDGFIAHERDSELPLQQRQSPRITLSRDGGYTVMSAQSMDDHMRYWLMKSEPDAYSLDDLERDGTTHWDGVRNYQARNLMRDEMSVGDRVLFYHSNAKPPGVVGIAEVASEAYPDHTAVDPGETYFDPTSDPDDPRWFMVDVRFVERLPRMVSLPELKTYPELQEMVLLNRSRLSVQPVTEAEYRFILERASEPAPD